jgi:hypothetical protein
MLGKEHPALSEDDVKWSLLNRRVLEHLSDNNLGLCRNLYLVMANYLELRGILKEALTSCLITCAYDLNGAQNRGGASVEILQQYPLLDPSMASLAPDVVASVQELAEELELRIDYSTPAF